jgi:hypothetical protein
MRVKTDKNFRMAKTTKRMLSLLPFKDQDQRTAFKHAMIDAQVAASIVPKTVKDKNFREVEAD